MEDATFIAFFKTLCDQDQQALTSFLHPDIIFQFPYGLPGTPKRLNGISEILENAVNSPFYYEFDHPRFIKSIGPGHLISEIIVKETYYQSAKCFEQNLICRTTIQNNKLLSYTEFFNPIIRLEGLLNLEKEDSPNSP